MADDMEFVHEVGPDVAEDFPENLKLLVEMAGFAVPTERDEGEEIIANRMLCGRCTCCASPLGKKTMFVIHEVGIITACCSGVCLTDLQLSGWLEEQYQDLVSRVKFRGGNPDIGGQQ